MKLTLEDVPGEIDEAIRQRAAAENKSISRVALDAILRGLEIDPPPTPKRDLSDVFDGTPLEPEVVQALEEQRQIDPEIWK